MPEALPWLTYVDGAHFAEAATILPEIAGATLEPLGETGFLFRLADYPWTPRFAVRTKNGYEVCDPSARRVSDGKRCRMHRRSR